MFFVCFCSFTFFVFAALQHIFFFGISIFNDENTTISCGFEVFSRFFLFYITYPKFTGTYVEICVRYRAIIKPSNIMFLMNKQGHINDALINIKSIIIIIIYGGHSNYGFEIKYIQMYFLHLLFRIPSTGYFLTIATIRGRGNL